jgi:hypothetical protein
VLGIVILVCDKAKNKPIANQAEHVYINQWLATPQARSRELVRDMLVSNFDSKVIV